MSEKNRKHIEDWEVTDLPHLLPYAHHRGSAVVKPEDLGRHKGLAMKAMYQQADIQLNQIKEQIDLLARQALDIQERMRISEDIYAAEIGFEPVIGNICHLYKRQNSSEFLSSISPDEWGKLSKLELKASVRLLGDRSWEVIS